MDVKTLAILLLAGRIISLGFTGLVLWRQWNLFKIAVPPWLFTFRKVMFVLAVTLFVGNFVPVVIDLLVIFGEVDRSDPSPVGVFYALDSNLTAVVASIAIWSLYKLAEKSIKRGDEV